MNKLDGFLFFKNFKVRFLFLILFLNHSISFANCEDPSLTVKWSDLTYVGKNLKDELSGSTCTLIQNVSTDNQARKQCNGVVYNPGNEQYLSDDRNLYGLLLTDKSSRTTNTLKYYFCIKSNNNSRDEIRKKYLCDKLQTEYHGRLKVEWFKAATGNDGDCKCGPVDAPRSALFFCGDPEAVASQCGEGLTPKNGQCYCPGNEENAVLTSAECSESKPNSVPVGASFTDDDIKTCFNDLEEEKKSCLESGHDLLNKCNQASEQGKSRTDDLADALSVLSQFSNERTAQKSGGTEQAIASCTKVSLATTGLIKTLGLFNNKCDDELKSCKSNCEDYIKFSGDKQSRQTKCKTDLNISEVDTEKFNIAFNNYWKTIYGEGTEPLAESFCSTRVASQKLGMNDLMSGIKEAQRSADICRCKLTPGSQGGFDCNDVMPANVCLSNPQAPGCQFSVTNCLASNNVNCPPVNLNAGIGSGMSIPGMSKNNGYVPNGGSVAPGALNTNGLKISSEEDEAAPQKTSGETSGSSSPFTSAQGGSAGSAGGGRGGGSDGGGAGGRSEGDGEPKSGLGGFFNNAKNALANMFGGGAKSGSSSGDGRSLSKDKQQPKKMIVRGVAQSNNGISQAKHKNIFQLMKDRYGDQYHTFLTVEEKK